MRCSSKLTASMEGHQCSSQIWLDLVFATSFCRHNTCLCGTTRVDRVWVLCFNSTKCAKHLGSRHRIETLIPATLPMMPCSCVSDSWCRQRAEERRELNKSLSLGLDTFPGPACSVAFRHHWSERALSQQTHDAVCVLSVPVHDSCFVILILKGVFSVSSTLTVADSVIFASFFFSLSYVYVCVLVRVHDSHGSVSVP